MEGFDFLRVGRSSGLREKENQKRPNKQHHQTIQTQVNSAHNSHTRQQQPLSIYTNLLTPAPITIAVTLSATYHKFCSCFSSLPPFLSQPITCLLALSGKIIFCFLLFHFPFVYVDRSLWRRPESCYLWPQLNSFDHWVCLCSYLGPSDPSKRELVLLLIPNSSHHLMLEFAAFTGWYHQLF